MFIAEPLVWFEASDFCYTIDTGSSLGLILDILLLSCCCRDHTALDLQDWFLHISQQIFDGMDVGVEQLIAMVGPGWLQGWSDQQLSLSSLLTLQHFPATSPFIAKNKGCGWFSCLYSLRTSSPTPTPPGTADCVAQVRYKSHSPECCS